MKPPLELRTLVRTYPQRLEPILGENVEPQVPGKRVPDLNPVPIDDIGIFSGPYMFYQWKVS